MQANNSLSVKVYIASSFNVQAKQFKTFTENAYFVIFNSIIILDA